MTRRPILLYPDPILRRKTDPVANFDAALLALVEEMKATMYDAPGVGLAAPQIGSLERIAIIDVDPGGPRSHLYVLANPRIVESSGADAELEGCLSIPGFTERVDRPSTVRVEAQDASGKIYEVAAEGLLARALCHEIDHLNGVLFIDHIRGLRRQLALRKLTKLGYAREDVPARPRR
ncbi:MAG: peptide deformylase [Thermoanaerobaculia bacterium]